MDVRSANQWPALTQQYVAAALGGVPMHRVTVSCRRIGGAYGGKIMGHMPTACAAAVAARIAGAPVRLHHERVDDMTMSGGRAPLLADYRAAYDRSTGVIGSVQLKLQYDSGCGTGGLGDVGMGTAWADSAYFTDDWSCEGSIRRTAAPNNCSTRAPGVISAIPAHEVGGGLEREGGAPCVNYLVIRAPLSGTQRN